jgi:hypothetical protein
MPHDLQHSTQADGYIEREVVVERRRYLTPAGAARSPRGLEDFSPAITATPGKKSVRFPALGSAAFESLLVSMLEVGGKARYHESLVWQLGPGASNFAKRTDNEPITN